MFVTWMNGAGVVWIFALMFLITADIVGRAAFGHPIAGVTEMVSLSLVACVFLQLGHAVLRGRLMRVEMGRRAARPAPTFGGSCVARGARGGRRGSARRHGARRVAGPYACVAHGGVRRRRGAVQDSRVADQTC